ncbi:hypothetical protein HDR58_03140 [bacterium]|nr:hypothetical protein [bacterium]
MKINSAIPVLNFTSKEQNINAEKQQKPKQEKKYVDPLTSWPLRGLGYTNDVGIAINELAPSAARLFWIPALMYFGADIYDKYKNKGDKYKPNPERACSQAVFQACASIIFPAIFGHMGMSAFSHIDKLRGEKLSTNAKEQTMRFIKSHTALHEVLEEGRDREETLKKFNETFDKLYKAHQKNYKNKNLLVKVYDNLLANSKLGAIANSDKETLKQYAKTQFLGILDNCKDTEVAKNVIDKKIFRLKAWKSLGAFTAIILAAQPVDHFVEHIVKKFVRPQMAKIVNPRTNQMNDIKMEKFGQSKTEEKSQKIG